MKYGIGLGCGGMALGGLCWKRGGDGGCHPAVRSLSILAGPRGRGHSGVRQKEVVEGDMLGGSRRRRGEGAECRHHRHKRKWTGIPFSTLVTSDAGENLNMVTVG